MPSTAPIIYVVPAYLQNPDLRYQTMYRTWTSRILFGYCNRVAENVPLEEIIPVEQSCWFYFDINIKTADLLGVACNSIRWTKVAME